MNNIDFGYVCTIIGNLAGIPVRVYKNNIPVFFHSIAHFPKDPITPYLDKILVIDSHIGYYITPSFMYYGIVNSGEYKMVLGPSVRIKSDDRTLKELAFLCDVPSVETDEFISGMKSIVSMPLDSIIQILCSVNYMANDEKLGLKDIRIFDDEQKYLSSKLEEESTVQKYDLDTGSFADVRDLHNTLPVEQTIVNFVRRGDTVALKEFVGSIPAMYAGIIAAEELRQAKNTFIVTATLVSRAAIRGGMDTDDALSLSDAYIQKCELLGDIERITNLQYHMVFDYTERVEKLRMGKSQSRLVLDVTNFVRRHISEPLTTSRIAKALFISRSRLSVNFKNHTGENLIDFILKEKTEEAQRLLRYTDKPVSAISAYLAFSSQSHFSRVFKKYAGCLPNEYRKRHSPTE